MTNGGAPHEGGDRAKERDVAVRLVFHVQADPRTMTPRALFHPARLARRPVLSTQSDERLVDLVRAGSDPAFEAIVERYRRALMRYVSRLLPPERAEDVIQQAFVKAYEAMHRDAAELNLRPWLYRIAHNGALNALRDRSLGHAELDERIDGVERPDQAFERTVGLRELVVAVQALPERQRSAILLRELEGRSYDEIAAALGVTDGAVRQLLNRARNALRGAAAAVIPMPLLTRLATGDSTEPVTARVGEMVGVGGGALAMKLCATALVTGAVVGGAAVMPNPGREQPGGGPVVAEAAEDDSSSESSDDDEAAGPVASEARGSAGSSAGQARTVGGSDPEGGRGDRSREAVDRSGERDGDDRRESRSGPGGGDDGGDRHSGPGGGEPADSPDDHSGPGGGGEPDDPLEEAREDNSGPGGGGESSSSGSGSGSGSGSSDSGDSPEPPDDSITELDSSGPGSGYTAPTP